MGRVGAVGGCIGCPSGTDAGLELGSCTSLLPCVPLEELAALAAAVDPRGFGLATSSQSDWSASAIPCCDRERSFSLASVLARACCRALCSASRELVPSARTPRSRLESLAARRAAARARASAARASRTAAGLLPACSIQQTPLRRQELARARARAREHAGVWCVYSRRRSAAVTPVVTPWAHRPVLRTQSSNARQYPAPRAPPRAPPHTHTHTADGEPPSEAPSGAFSASSRARERRGSLCASASSSRHASRRRPHPLVVVRPRRPPAVLQSVSLSSVASGVVNTRVGATSTSIDNLVIIPVQLQVVPPATRATA